MIPGRDFCYEASLDTPQPLDCVPRGAMDPLYLLYTSGTTGVPKVKEESFIMCILNDGSAEHRQIPPEKLREFR
jgi:long-subunit acyl-CoA synthetase (AMP-forming)